MRRGRPALALLAVACLGGCVPDAGRPDRSETGNVYQLLFDAEDARPESGEALSLLLDATGSEEPALRRIAVRALGRLESPSLAGEITRHLADDDPSVRAAAAEALAQSVHRAEGAPVLADLLDRVDLEEDAAVRSMLARSIGRLRLGEVDRRRAVDALLQLAGTAASAPEETLVGVALGFESLVRLSAGAGVSRPAADVLVALMSWQVEESPDAAGGDAESVRALAASALGQARRLSLELLERALEDPGPEVRRVVLGYLDAVPPSQRDRLVSRALADPSPQVTIAALRYLSTVSRTEPRCAQLLAAAGMDTEAAIRIVALEALARPCPTLTAQRSLLSAAAAEIADEEAPWQPAARALLSLAALDPDAASSRLAPFVAHASPFVRGWAARAAAATRDVPALFSLAVDPSPNVRGEAIRGLFAVEGHGLDDFLLGQLEGDDPQLLMTVSGLLEGAPDRDRVARAALDAFERISRAERETWRDPRMALLARIAESGGASLASRLTPFLGDYDPLVAEAVADILEAWTDEPHQASPEPLPRAPAPTLAELRALQGATLTLEMRGGGALVVELLADQALTNVARLVRLADSGHYDELTFHRWVPNFVIQGGSPGANEYQGDGSYTRDEIGGVPHWRGTVGLSTRGRDTGDAQVFVNLVDNPRLDYDYTVMGRLVEGYDVLDGILEGAVIERAVVARTR